jgi:acyl-CoA thioesterase I
MLSLVVVTRRAVVVGALLWCLSVTAIAESPARVLLVVGDSLSAAYNMDREAGWVHLLTTRLREYLGEEWQVVNGSISGDTTRGGLSRLPTLLASAEPAVVIIALGGNDGLRGLQPSEIRSNLTAMIDLAKAADAQVLLAGVRIPANYGPAYSRLFEATFPAVAELREVALVPSILLGVDERAELFQADGIHPSEAAQPLILETIWESLRPLLSD